MASFSYSAHVRAETGTKRPLASVIGEDLTAAAKRTAAPFSGTAARPGRGTNSTMPVARWSYEAMQEGDVAFVNATASSGVKPGFFLQSVGINTLNAMMRQEEYLVGDPRNLMKPTLARHSYVCNLGMYERSKPTEQFRDSTLETNHPARSFILEGVVCAKTDAMNADEMIDVGGAEGVVAVGGLSALNVYNHSAMSKSRVLDHVYVVLMAKRVTRRNKWMLQYGLINSLHVWHGHVEKHFGTVTVLKVWQLGRIVDTNYARDRDDNKLLKLIVAIKPLIARAPNAEETKGGMVPVDGDKTLEALVLPTSIEKRIEFYKERNEQIKQQEECKDHISSKSFAALRMSPGLTIDQKLEIDNLNSQLDALRKQSQRSNEENALLKLRIQRLNSKGASGNDKVDRITELERILAEVRSAEASLQEENSRFADELAFFLQANQDHEAEIEDLNKKLVNARDEIYALQQDIKRLEEELNTLRGSSPSEEVIALRKELELATKVKNNATAELNALKRKSAGSSSSSGSSVPADNARIEELTRVVSTLEEEKKDLLQQLQSRQRLEDAEEYGDKGNPAALKAAAASFIQVLQYRNNAELSKDQKAFEQAFLNFENRLAELTNQQLEKVEGATTYLTSFPNEKVLLSFFSKEEYDKYIDNSVEANMKDNAFLSQKGIKASDKDRTTEIEKLRQSEVEMAKQEKANADEKRALYSYILGYDTPEGVNEWKTNLENNELQKSFLTGLSFKIMNMKQKGRDPQQRIDRLTAERKLIKDIKDSQELERLRENEMFAKKAAEMRSHMRVYNEWKGVWQALYNNSAENAPTEYKKAWINNKDVLKFLAMDRTEAIQSSKSFRGSDYSGPSFTRREEVRGLLYVFFLTPTDTSNNLELSRKVKEVLIPGLNNKLEELDKKNPRPGPNDLNPDIDPDFVLPDWAEGYKPDANFKPASVSDLTDTAEGDKRTGPTQEELEEREKLEELEKLEAKKIREITKWMLSNLIKKSNNQQTDLPKDEWTEEDIAEIEREDFKRVGDKWERVIKQPGGSGKNQPKGGKLQPPALVAPALVAPPMTPPSMKPPAMVTPPVAPPPPPMKKKP